MDYPRKFMIATVAEREGFEPSVEILSLRRFSKPLPSATRPPLHVTTVGIGPHPQRKLSPGRSITDAGILPQLKGEAQGMIRIRTWLKCASTFSRLPHGEA